MVWSNLKFTLVIKIKGTEFLPQTLIFVIHNLATQCCAPLIFQITHSARSNILRLRLTPSEAEFKKFEPRLKFKAWLKYGWFYLKSYIYTVSRFMPALNWNRFLADLRRGSNSLNSDTGRKNMRIIKFEFVAKTKFLLWKTRFEDRIIIKISDLKVNLLNV